MVFGLIWDRTVFGALFLIVLCVSLQEFYAMTLGSRFFMQQKLGMLAGVAAFLFVACHRFYGLDIHWLILVLLPLLLIHVTAIFSDERDDFGNISYIYAGLLYIALPITLSPFIVMDGNVFDGWLLLSFFILIWVSDIGAYCFGTLFGQKSDSAKLAPEISPKKSWWGFWSGLVLCIAGAVALHFMGWLPFTIWHSIALGAIISITGVAGDLFESQWKRYCHVKDSGNCIPGHGGMLDRFDSSLVAIPTACVYLSIFGLL